MAFPIRAGGGGGDISGLERRVSAIENGKGKADGWAPLNSQNKVPNIHLPWNGSYKFDTKTLTTNGTSHSHKIGGIEFGYERLASSGGQLYMMATNMGESGQRTVALTVNMDSVEHKYHTKAAHTVTDTRENVSPMASNGSESCHVVMDINNETWVINIAIFGSETQKVHIWSERVS